MRMQEQPGRDSAQAPGPLVRPRTTPGSAPAAGEVAGRTPADILALQRTAGNAAVSRMLDQEQHQHGGGCGHEAVQRRVSPSAPVQRQVSPLDVVSKPGRPMESRVLDKVEYYTGERPEGLRIHTDSAAHDSAVGINADAYTSGNHIAFQRGRYNPDTPSGMEMILHEYDHAKAQAAGPVPGRDMGDGTQMSSPEDSGEVRAEKFARDSMVNPVGAQQSAE